MKIGTLSNRKLVTDTGQPATMTFNKMEMIESLSTSKDISQLSTKS